MKLCHNTCRGRGKERSPAYGDHDLPGEGPPAGGGAAFQIRRAPGPYSGGDGPGGNPFAAAARFRRSAGHHGLPAADGNQLYRAGKQPAGHPDCGASRRAPPAGLPGKRQHPALFAAGGGCPGPAGHIYRAGPAAPAPGGGPFGRFAAERHHCRGAAAPLGDRACRAADPRRFFPAGECQLPVCFRTDAGAAPFDRAQ